jgi:hypothetical protein
LAHVARGRTALESVQHQQVRALGRGSQPVQVEEVAIRRCQALALEGKRLRAPQGIRQQRLGLRVSQASRRAERLSGECQA